MLWVIEAKNIKQPFENYNGIDEVMDDYVFYHASRKIEVGDEVLSIYQLDEDGTILSSYSPKQLAAKIEKLIAAKKMKQGGIGIYPGFTHYDIRGTKARW